MPSIFGGEKGKPACRRLFGGSGCQRFRQSRFDNSRLKAGNIWMGNIDGPAWSEADRYRRLMMMKTRTTPLVILVLSLAFFPATGNTQTQPIHDVSLVASSNTVYEGQAFSLFVDYDAYVPNTPDVHLKSGGLGIRIFYDSTKLDFSGCEYFAPASYRELPIAVQDTANHDGKIATDMFIQMSWAEHVDPTWPEGTLPQFAAVLNFVLLTSEGAQINDDDVNVYFKSLSGGYVSSGVAITGIERIPGDFDCDGQARLDDCISMLRLLSGIDVARVAGCPRPLGDFDGDGKTGLGDCVGILRTIAGIR